MYLVYLKILFFFANISADHKIVKMISHLTNKCKGSCLPSLFGPKRVVHVRRVPIIKFSFALFHIFHITRPSKGKKWESNVFSDPKKNEADFGPEIKKNAWPHAFVLAVKSICCMFSGIRLKRCIYRHIKNGVHIAIWISVLYRCEIEEKIDT